MIATMTINRELSDSPAMDLPTGTVTFLLTDVESSTRMWEADNDRASAAIDRQYELLHTIITSHDGVLPLEQGEGDSVVAAFTRASAACAAALDVQRAFAEERWPSERPLRVRIALHTGEAQLRNEQNYFGPAIVRCARLRSIGHGGQTLLSEVTRDLLADHPIDDLSFRDLGVHRLKDLGRVEHVWQLCHPDLTVDFPPLRSLDDSPRNLPVPLTSFVGREAELAGLRELVGEHRLVTLTGSGGCGKTRLALQLATSLDVQFDGTARWVELAPISDPALVPSAIATALGHHDDHGRPLFETLPEQLGDRDLLAVFDNCEHLLDGVAEFVAQLLPVLPRMRIIATSREPLGIVGETAWRVPALDTETAAQLFVERAANARPGFVPDPAERAAIARIGERLDHVPLAIELAAARVRMMQPTRIADALDDRFRLLTGGGRTAMPRQQTLEASVAWSHDLLDEEERALFRRLSVFSRGFTLEAAEAVCADDDVDPYAVLELVTQLVDKSLVQVDSERGRYRLPETLRQYARERLFESGEGDGVRHRHLEFFLALAEETAPAIVTGDGPTLMAGLDAEHENLDVALEWAEASGEQERMLRMTTALTLYFELRGHLASGCQWFARALEPEGPPSVVRARALWGAAHVALYAHDFGTFMLRVPEALAMAESVDDSWTAARALNARGYAELWFDPELGHTTLEHSVALGREIDDAWAVADGLKMMSVALLTQHKVDEAQSVLEALYDVARALDNGFFVAWYHTGIGSIAWYRGDIDGARDHFELALEHCRAVGDPATGGIAASWLAEVDALAGDYATAEDRLESLLARHPDGDDFDPDEPTTVAVAALALHRGDPRGALSALAPLVDPDDIFPIPLWTSWAQTLRGAALLAIDDEAGASAALAIARQCAGPPLDSPWLASQADHQLGRLAAHAGCTHEAERLHHAALAMQADHGFLPGVADSLEALATIALGAESHEEGARLFGAAAALRRDSHLARWPADEAVYGDAITGLRTALGAEFDDIWASGEALTVPEAIAYATRARGERKRPSSGWDALTPMERQVVDLAAEGLTNPQIAERLFVARGTVKVHLGHVFPKLGVSTRTELAAMAARHSADDRD